ncbi:type I restriction enzyme, S subunit [Candidatus Kryptonium thompsonii]|nr:type I restriction enzyme, S subunit [Candidatus Kryptonium thompsoni]
MSEGPYKLPEGWRWVKLGEVATIERRTVDPRRFPQSTFYLYSIPAYDKGQSPEKLAGSQIGSTKIVIGPGMCLFSKLNPRIPRAWVVTEVPQDGVSVASTEFMPLRPNSSVLDLDYLGKLLVTEGFLSQVRSDVTGATGSRQRLKPEVVLNALIPLPPLSEQHRIVERIEELMERIREAKRLREEAKQDAERLWQAVLAETFPRPGDELPEDWRWVKLEEVAVIERHTKKPTDLPPELPYVGLEHVESGTGSVDIDKCPPVSSVSSQVYLYDESHVLYSKLRPYLNKVYLPEGKGACTTELLPLKPDPSRVDRHFLAWYLRSPGFVANANAHTTGSRQPRVDLRALVTALIPLPPLSEQKRIVEHLEAVQERIRALKEAQAYTEAELKRLEQSILEKAFRGEL